jgi:hypothetical protein
MVARTVLLTARLSRHIVPPLGILPIGILATRIAFYRGVTKEYEWHPKSRYLCAMTWAILRKSRAGSRIRTDDLLITNQLLYQLSYAGFVRWR